MEVNASFTSLPPPLETGSAAHADALTAHLDWLGQVKATAGDTHLGGEDFDNRMVKHFTAVRLLAWLRCEALAVRHKAVAVRCEALAGPARKCLTRLSSTLQAWSLSTCLHLSAEVIASSVCQVAVSGAHIKAGMRGCCISLLHMLMAG